MHNHYSRLTSLRVSLAARRQGVNTEKVLPQIDVVGNGFISLMASQAKGYAYIAP
jgi:intracellular sulfur oxidation DsrE/DsrF family protein